MSINDKCYLEGTTTVITGNRVRRSMSSSESRRREVTEQMWYVAEDCSRSVERRLEKLGHRRLRVGYGEQTVSSSPDDDFDSLVKGVLGHRVQSVWGLDKNP